MTTLGQKQAIRRTITAGFLSLLFFTVLTGCSSSGRAKGPDRVPTVPVVVATAVRKDVPIQVRAIGAVEPFSTVAVKSMVAGELTTVHFTQGQDVKQGDLLFSIDKAPFEAALAQAESTLARDTAQAANARAQANRYQALLHEGVVAREQTEQMQTAADALDAAVRADRAAVDTARVNLRYCSIYAPIGGRTGDLMVHAGNLVKSNDVPLVTINQITPTYVDFSVPEQFLPDIKQYSARGKLKVEAGAPGQPTATGTLKFVDNTVDSTTGTIKLKGLFENRERRLWPAQFVNVTLTLTVQPGAVVVPTQAVQTGQQGQYVLVVKADNSAETRNIVLDRVVEGQAVVRQGLAPGEVVITDGHLRVTPGAKVDARTVGTPQAGGTQAGKQEAAL